MNIQATPTDRTREPAREPPGHCFHCGEPLPSGRHYQAEISGAPRELCCAGCQAVAQTIVDAGLEDYYNLRTAPAAREQQRVPEFLREARVYAEPAVADEYVHPDGAAHRTCTLLLQDLECSACCWLIERQLTSLEGMAAVNLNYSNHRARIRFDPERLSLEAILATIARLGYRALPYEPSHTESAFRDEDRARLKRLGIAGLFGMQVMILAVALYSGEWWGMAPNIEQLLRWASALMALPIVGYCAQPFFSNALRSLRNRSPGMDVPVSLGIALAFSASAVATVQGHSRVYFDSLAMFVFFLLLARYLEFLARRRGQQQREQLIQTAPELARRMAGTATETIPVALLKLGDRLRVLGGELIPADARVVLGSSTVDESLLSGESRPVAKQPGDTVIAGSVNLDQPLEVTVLALGRDRVMARILDLVDQATEDKPAVAQLADRIAGVFVVAIVLAAAAVAGFWLLQGSDLWLRTTIAVLIVTCPCALSLATPAALTAASGALARHGIIPAKGLRLEALAAINHVMFDKTGTLTSGAYRLHGARALGAEPVARGLGIAAAMEDQSMHPLAKALVRAAGGCVLTAHSVRIHAGEGLEAVVEGQHWWLGSVAWMKCRCKDTTGLETDCRGQQENDTVVVLADCQGPKFVFALGDEMRSDAPQLVCRLHQAGITTSVCSGDEPRAVAALAGQAGIREHRGGCAPADKLTVLEGLRNSGQRVAMVGDGVNDAPVLAGANVSFALGSGTQAARISADFILLGEHLPALYTAIVIARKTRRIITQNLGWALVYNLLAIPAAAAGWVPPWLAAIGMSLSSLLVVANSLRCGRIRIQR